MSTVFASVRVNRPPEEVFAYLSDLSRMADWWQGIAGVRASYPVRKGSGGMFTMKSGALPQTVDFQVREIEPGRRLVLAFCEARSVSQAEFTLSDGAGGTRVLLGWTVAGGSWKSLIIAPLKARAAQAELASNLRLFKALAEDAEYIEDARRLAA